MPDPKSYHFDLPSGRRPGSVALAEEWYPGLRETSIEASSSRIFDPVTGIRAIVIHATAGGSSSGAVSVIFDKKASFHWLVPDENEAQHGKFVWATCFEARAAWHVRNSASHAKVWDGHQRINHFSLGIEVVNAQIGNDAFSDWQVKATADIVRYCWAKYPNLVHVVSHAMLDPARRSDPGTLFPWDAFRSQVLDTPERAMPALVRSAPPPDRTKRAPKACCMDTDGRPVEIA